MSAESLLKIKILDELLELQDKLRELDKKQLEDILEIIHGTNEVIR